MTEEERKEAIWALVAKKLSDPAFVDAYIDAAARALDEIFEAPTPDNALGKLITDDA